MPLRGARRPSARARDGFRAVGRVERPWGLRGDLKIFPLTDFPQRFDPGARVYAGGVARRVLRSRWQKGRIFVGLEGVERPEQAEALRGALLEIPEDDTPDFAEGEYYVDAIEGCSVRDVEGEAIGTVREVLQPGANDVYVVARSGKDDLLVPAVRDVVVAVDVSARMLTVDLPPGLDSEAAGAAAPAANPD